MRPSRRRTTRSSTPRRLRRPLGVRPASDRIPAGCDAAAFVYTFVDIWTGCPHTQGSPRVTRDLPIRAGRRAPNGSSRMNKEIALTPEGQAKLEDELRHLETVRRREVGERIKEAKEFGDISENSEYDDAKNEQAWVESRIIEVTADSRARDDHRCAQEERQGHPRQQGQAQGRQRETCTSTRSSAPPRPILPTTRSPTSRPSARRFSATRRATSSRSPLRRARSSSTPSSRSPASPMTDEQRIAADSASADADAALVEDDPFAVRRAKLDALRAAGQQPYVDHWDVTARAAELEADYAELEAGRRDRRRSSASPVVSSPSATRARSSSSSSETPPATCSSSLASTSSVKTRSRRSRTSTWATGSARSAPCCAPAEASSRSRRRRSRCSRSRCARFPRSTTGSRTPRPGTASATSTSSRTPRSATSSRRASRSSPLFAATWRRPATSRSRRRCCTPSPAARPRSRS